MSCLQKIHRIECQEPWLSFLRSGTKPVEGRKNSPKFREIKVGDLIEFYYGKDSFQSAVVGISRFDTLEDYLKTVTIEKALPGVSSFEEAVRIYLQWSTPEEIAQRGFLGIFVKPLI